MYKPKPLQRKCLIKYELMYSYPIRHNQIGTNKKCSPCIFVTVSA